MNLKSFATYLPEERNYPLRIDIFICVLLVLATVAVYWQLNTFEFIGYDDDKYVTENPVVQNGLTREGLVWAFKSTHASNWHPLTWLSHMLDVELYGMDAGAHHLTGLILHILNVQVLSTTVGFSRGCHGSRTQPRDCAALDHNSLEMTSINHDILSQYRIHPDWHEWKFYGADVRRPKT